MAALLQRPLIEEETPANLDANRTVKIVLAADDPRKEINISWCAGKIGKVSSRPVKRVLKRGESVVMPIQRARAFFGQFTIPHDLEDEQDERRFSEASEFFHRERERVLLAFGDYPRPTKIADGPNPIGPHRFPHIIATVIEDDGTQWQPIDLHEIYGIGEHDPDEHLRPSYHAQIAAEEKAIRARTIGKDDERDKEIAELRGMVQTLLAQQGASKPAQDGGKAKS